MRRAREELRLDWDGGKRTLGAARRSKMAPGSRGRQDLRTLGRRTRAAAAACDGATGMGEKHLLSLPAASCPCSRLPPPLPAASSRLPQAEPLEAATTIDGSWERPLEKGAAEQS